MSTASSPPTSLVLSATSSVLLLTLFPLALLRLRRSFAPFTLVTALVLASTLALAVAASFALVALVNKDRERTWTLVGGTLACVALILVDLSTLSLAHTLTRLSRPPEPSSLTRRRPPRSFLSLFLLALLLTLFLSSTTLHVALLCLPSLPYSNLKTLAVARGALHALFEGTVVLWGLMRWKEGEKRERGEEARLPSQGWGDVSAPTDVEAGRDALASLKTVRSLAVSFLALQLLAVALDILSAALPLRSSTTNKTAPQLRLFGSATSPVGNLVMSAIAWVRWTGMVEVVAALYARTRPTDLPPTSTHLDTALYHHPHSLPPTPTPSLRPLPDLPTTPPSPRYERLPSSRAQVQQTRERKSMEKSGAGGTPGQGSVGSSFLLLEMDAEDEGGTFQPSIAHAQPEMEVEPKEEDLVVVPSLPVRQAGRLSPSLPPLVSLPLLTTPTGSPLSRHRPHRSLPTLLTGEPPSRPFTPLLTPVTPNDERSPPLSRAGSTSPTLSRWRLPRSSEDKSPSVPPSPTAGKTSAPPSPRKLRRGRGASVSSVPTLSLGPPLALDAEREKGTNTPASSISRATGRRRSGSVGSILRSFAAGTGGRPSMETKASVAAGQGLWWDVEPNEEEDDPFVRSAPPLPLPLASSSVSMSRASTDGEPSTDEGSGAVTPLRLKKALLEAIQEPDGGDAALASPTRRVDDDEMERMLTPPPPHIDDFDSRHKHSPSAASSIAYAYRARSASQSSSGSVFREHLDTSDGDTSSMPPPSPSSSLALSTFAAFGGGRASVPSSPVLAPRRRTDAMISPLMLPRRVASEGANEPSIPQQVASPASTSTRTSSPSITPKASRLPRRLSRQKRPSILSLRSNSAFSTSPASNATPQRRSPSFSLLPTRSSTVSASSNTLFSSPAFASLRRITTPRRSPSPVPSNRPSESSDLSFACRGLVDSSSDFNVSIFNTPPPFVAPAGPSQTGDEVEKVETPSSSRTKRRSRTTKGSRNAWWRQLPSGSRPSTLYRQNSLASGRVRPTSAPARSSGSYSRPPSYGSGSSAARYLQASQVEGGAGGSSSGHIRSVSLPLPLPPVPSTPPPLSRFELPAINDVSPIGSSIFHLPSRLSGGSPRSTRSRGSPKVSARVAVPVTMPSASFADQQSLRETSSYDTANTSPDYAVGGERFPTTPTPEPLAHELHELTSLVRSFAGSPGGEISTSDGSATPTSTISSLPFTPLSPVFSLDPSSPTLTYSRARQARGEDDAEEEIELMSPLTPASPGFGRKD
ncbi:hypothetical protein JCM10049v2_003036 [Rhodotorula toruloides]